MLSIYVRTVSYIRAKRQRRTVYCHDLKSDKMAQKYFVYMVHSEMEQKLIKATMCSYFCMHYYNRLQLCVFYFITNRSYDWIFLDTVLWFGWQLLQNNQKKFSHGSEEYYNDYWSGK